MLIRLIEQSAIDSSGNDICKAFRLCEYVDEPLNVSFLCRLFDNLKKTKTSFEYMCLSI